MATRCQEWVQQRWGWRRHRRVSGLLGLLVMGSGVPVAAQATYTVFPAKPSAASAQPTRPGAGAHVSLVVQDSTLDYVIGALAKQANLRPVYNTSNPLFSKRVTVRVVDANVMEAFAVVLRGTGLVAKLRSDDATLLIGAPSGMSPAERARLAGGVVVGRVTDSASGAGLGGAMVRVAGTKLSTVTSDSGQFTLKDVPLGDHLLMVRLFGYRPVERSVTVVDSQQTLVRIVMVPVPTVLSGVVTTAVGQQARYEVGSDITVLNADSIQRVAPVSTITDMLETRVPGLIVQHTSGIPGAPSRLRLRGLSSINMSADPIVIVDGIRVYADQSGSTTPGLTTNGGANTQYGGATTGGGSSVANAGKATGLGAASTFAGPSALDQIDPGSIEKIEVLKGPSATAIYGSDAANGVIVVTTKHGRVGPTHWSLSVDNGLTTLPGSWPVNYFLFAHQVVNQITSYAGNVGNIGSVLTTGYFLDPDVKSSAVRDSVVASQVLNNSRYSPLTGSPGANHDASLTVSGGSGTMTYSATGSAATQSGYLHLPPIEVENFQALHGFPAPNWMRTPDQYTTYGASGQMTVQLGQRGGTLALTSSLFRSAQQQSSLQNDLYQLSTTYVDTTQLATVPLFPDYYALAQLATTTYTDAVSLSNWSPWRWLPPIMATAGLSVQNQNNTSLLPRDYVVCPLNCSEFAPSGFGQNLYYSAIDTLGSYSLSQGTNTSGTVTLGTTFAPRRLVSTAVGINVHTLSQSNYTAYTRGLPLGVSVPSSFVYSNGTGPGYGTASSATYGWYVQPTLNLHSKFFVSPGFRLDGGSNSGGSSGVSSGSLSLFPKIDMSWIAVSRPPSHPLFGALTLLRPRIAFGIAGVQPNPGELLRLLQPAQVTPVTSSGTGVPVDVLNVQTLGNSQLHPERDRDLEGGVDAQFWNDRLSLTLTGYNKTAYDAILAVPVGPSVQATGGAEQNYENVGTIRNTGVEATIFARLVDSRLMDWSVNANVAKNTNHLVSLAPGVASEQVNQGRGPAGLYTTRLVPGYSVDGLWARPIVGFADANHNNIIDPGEIVVGDSAVYVGAQQPNYELTISTTLAFFNNRLQINTSVDYQNGLTQTMPNSAPQNSMYLLSNNPGLTLAQQAALVAGFNGETGIGLLQTVNTLRWNTLSVTYLAPPRLAHMVHVPTLSLALQGSNLGLHTNYQGKDPNVNAFTSGNLTQDTGGLLPQPRVWNLRVTIGN